MIDLEEYKKSLGEVTDRLPENEILKVRRIQDEIAEIFYPIWLETIRNKNTNNKQLCQVTMKIETALSTVE